MSASDYFLYILMNLFILNNKYVVLTSTITVIQVNKNAGLKTSL